jgi:hypothetical protein
VLPDIFTFSNRAAQIALAARHRLPAIYAVRGQAIDGGLTDSPANVVVQPEGDGAASKSNEGSNEDKGRDQSAIGVL